MTIINLQTIIKASIEVCFDLSRSVELHMISTAHTNERAVAGRTSGLCTTGDVITWRAKHFGIYQQLTVQITECLYPTFFRDEMISGAFQSFTHEHHFKQVGDKTIMDDGFEYEVPYGFVGKVFDRVVLRNYMQKLLTKRNETIQQFAESGEWNKLLLKQDFTNS